MRERERNIFKLRSKLLIIRLIILINWMNEYINSFERVKKNFSFSFLNKVWEFKEEEEEEEILLEWWVIVK